MTGLVRLRSAVALSLLFFVVGSFLAPLAAYADGKDIPIKVGDPIIKKDKPKPPPPKK